MLELCFSENNLPLNFPLSQKHILLFLAWLTKRERSASTINSYLAALRQLHLSLGLEIPTIRTDLINQLLTGKKNMEFCNPPKKPSRLPITPTALRLLKLAISKEAFNKHDKRLIWFLATLAFHGSFRMGELLTKKTSAYDPSFTLLKNDLHLSSSQTNGTPHQSIEVALRSSKSSARETVIVDIFATNSDLCPVNAYKKWDRTSTTPSLSPIFRFSSGKLVTAAWLNLKLKTWLNSSIHGNLGYFTGHSFRAGVPTILGSLGFEDDELKSIGRWSSRAYEIYTKQPRTKRRAIARAFGNLNL